ATFLARPVALPRELEDAEERRLMHVARVRDGRPGERDGRLARRTRPLDTNEVRAEDRANARRLSSLEVVPRDRELDREALRRRARSRVRPRIVRGDHVDVALNRDRRLEPSRVPAGEARDLSGNFLRRLRQEDEAIEHTVLGRDLEREEASLGAI